MTTSEQYWTVVRVKLIFRPWGVDRFAYVILTMIPPVVIVIFLQDGSYKDYFKQNE